MNDIRTLLRDLAGDEPPVVIDLDRQITRGRRRQRVHRFGAVGAAVALVAGVGGGVIVLRPGSGTTGGTGGPGDTAAAGQPALPPVTAPEVTDLPSEVSTTKSKALRSELERLAPELGTLTNARRYDFVWSDGKRQTPHLSAGSAENDASSGRRSIGVEVGDRAAGIRVVTVCEKAGTPPPSGPGAPVGCEVRELADGSVAFMSEFTQDGSDPSTLARHETGVRLVRPDNIVVYVGSTRLGSTGAPPLTLARALEIAQALTVTP